VRKRCNAPDIAVSTGGTVYAPVHWLDVHSTADGHFRECAGRLQRTDRL